MPCGRTKSFSPHESRNRPSRSKITIGWSPRLKTKTRSRESVATPATSTKRQPSGNTPQPSQTSNRGSSPAVVTGPMSRTPAHGALPGPGDVVAGRVEPDPVQALIRGDVQQVLIGTDAEV